MAEFEVDFPEEELKAILNRVTDAIPKVLQLVATDLWGNVKKEAPVDEGRLANDWDLFPEGKTEWHLRSGASYALAVARGTGIYGVSNTPIRPVNKRILRWVGKGGQVIFAMSVKGQKPNPFDERAIERTKGNVPTLAKAALRAALG